MSKTPHILIIKLGAFGDFVQALGPMKAIRAHHPDARLTLLTTKPFTELARQSGYVDDIWIDERPKWHQPKSWIKLKERLDHGKFTRVYDLQNNDRTALYFKLMTPKPEWVGAAKGASHENASPDRTRGHAFDGHIQTLAQAGITDVHIDTLDWLTGRIDSFDLPERYVLIVPGAAPARPLKRWPAKHYGALCRQLMDRDLTPVLIGGEHEVAIARDIRRYCPEAIDLSDQTAVTDLPALARGARFAIGNDTGPMHMIGPTGCPALVLFSSDSDPARHKPIGQSVETLQEKDLNDLMPGQVWDYLAACGFIQA